MKGKLRILITTPESTIDSHKNVFNSQGGVGVTRGWTGAVFCLNRFTQSDQQPPPALHHILGVTWRGFYAKIMRSKLIFCTESRGLMN